MLSETHVNALLGSGNTLTALLGLLLAVVSANRLLSGGLEGGADRLAAGMVLLGLGLFLQRGFWAVNRALAALGYTYKETFFYEQYSWVTIFAVPLLLLGLGLVLHAFFTEFHGDLWLKRFLAVIVALWAGIAWLLWARSA